MSISNIHLINFTRFNDRSGSKCWLFNDSNDMFSCRTLLPGALQYSRGLVLEFSRKREQRFSGTTWIPMADPIRWWCMRLVPFSMATNGVSFCLYVHVINYLSTKYIPLFFVTFSYILITLNYCYFLFDWFNSLVNIFK